MPFGLNPNPNWFVFNCPLCKRKYSLGLHDKGERESSQEWIDQHILAHKRNIQQQTLDRSPFRFPFEVEKNMKIPEAAIAQPTAKSGLTFIRVGDLGLKLSQTKEFTIIGDVEQAGTEKDPYFSCPVSYVGPNGPTKGQYRLNRTTLRSFVPTLGDETDNWTGARFTAFANMVTNPKTGQQQLGLTVLVDTVKAPPKK